jgi:ATP-binding cassette subfamily B protein
MEETKKFDLQTLQRVLKLAGPYRGLFIGAIALAIVLAPISVLRPYLINVMVDDYIVKFDLDGLTRMAIILVAILFTEAILRYIFIYSTNLLGQSVIRDLRTRVFDHIIRLRLTFFDRTPIGRFTTRTVSDIETINQVFSQGVITIMADMLGIIAVLSIMLWSNWKLTLICLLTFPFLVIGSYIFKEKVKKAFQIVRNQISRMNSFLQERITGMQVVQIFNAEEQEMDKFKKINREYTQANLNSILYYAIFFPFVEIISAASLGLMVWYGARGVLDQSVTPGMLIAFPIYISMLFRPIRFIADKFNTLQMGLVAAERVFNVLDTREFIPNEGTQKPERLEGAIAFEDVHFSYETGTPVLRGVTFDVQPGHTLAIVGSTGSGKSTIINLINRFYDIQSGKILIDGHEIRSYDLYALRKRIAIVLQDVFLFAGTIFDNITFNDERVSEESVIEAAKAIGAHDFFQRLPGGYEFKITERGSNLSMGQRQLISFVRALVFDPDILILDEATSSIDTETESLIQYAIEKLITKRTSIIIAHRLSTIQHAEKVLVLNKGEIVEYGPQDELLKKENGHYRELYEHQFVHPLAPDNY